MFLIKSHERSAEIQSVILNTVKDQINFILL